MAKHANLIIQQFMADIQWKYLILSIVLAYCILLLVGSLIASYNVHSFVNAFNTGQIMVSNYNNFQDAANRYVNSYYWVPFHIAAIIIAQLSSCLFLVKHTKGLELTNGVAHAVFTSIFVYQLNFVSALIGSISSIVVAFKVKEKS